MFIFKYFIPDNEQGLAILNARLNYRKREGRYFLPHFLVTGRHPCTLSKLRVCVWQCQVKNPYSISDLDWKTIPYWVALPFTGYIIMIVPTSPPCPPATFFHWAHLLWIGLFHKNSTAPRQMARWKFSREGGSRALEIQVGGGGCRLKLFFGGH